MYHWANLRPISTKHFLSSSFGRYSKTNIICMTMNKKTVSGFPHLYVPCEGADLTFQGPNKQSKAGWGALNLAMSLIQCSLLTGSPLVTTPWRCTTLGCRNWSMMAASWRNLTFSVSREPLARDFTATSCVPLLVLQTALSTVPNWPDPRCVVSLTCAEKVIKL